MNFRKIKYLVIALLFILSQANTVSAQINAREEISLKHKISSFKDYLSKNIKYKGSFEYSNIMFNLADIYATIGIKDSAFFFLQKAIDICPSSLQDCAEVYNPDILGLYSFSKWKNTREWMKFDSVVTKVYMLNNRHLMNPQLSLEILKASGYDQSVRFYVLDVKSDRKAISDLKAIDSYNTKFIQKVVRQYGFPSISKFGEEASNAAFLLVQHSDDLTFQKGVLKEMKGLIISNDVSKENYAYLYDRVMVRDKGYQLYGTQVNSDGRLFPIVDSININSNRKKMGLGELK